jgi:hypothetical protein
MSLGSTVFADQDGDQALIGAGGCLHGQGGIKTLAHIIKRHINRSKISGAAVKLVLRACTNSPQTLIAVMKEKVRASDGYHQQCSTSTLRHPSACCEPHGLLL